MKDENLFIVSVELRTLVSSYVDTQESKLYLCKCNIIQCNKEQEVFSVK